MSASTITHVSHLSLGVDVGTTRLDGYALGWDAAGTIISDERAVLRTALMPPTHDLRPLVAAGDLAGLANATYPAAAAIASTFWEWCLQCAANAGLAAPSSVFVDTMTAIARNGVGSGRLTDRVVARVDGVYAQMTPSLGRVHGADWSWQFTGIAVMAGALTQGALDRLIWDDMIRHGLHARCLRAAGLICREKFPNLELAMWRECETLLRSVLLPLGNRQEVEMVITGISRHVGLSHTAASLVCALGALAYVRPDFLRQFAWPDDIGVPLRHTKRRSRFAWTPLVPNAAQTEGAVEVCRTLVSGRYYF